MDRRMILLRAAIFFLPDSVHAFVQPTRQAPTSKVVHTALREMQEKVLPRTHLNYSHKEAENVLIS